MKNIINKCKNVSPRRSDRMFKVTSTRILALLLAAFFLVGVVRVSFIMLVKGSEYRSAAEENQLYDQTIPAVRGTIYDSNMTPLVTSSTSWTLIADPYSIKERFNTLFRVRVDDSFDYSTAEKLYDVYIKFISKKIAEIVNADEADVLSLIGEARNENGEIVRYNRIKSKLTASQRLKLDEMFSKTYYCKEGKFINKEDYSSEERKNMTLIRSQIFFTYEDNHLRVYPDNNFASTVIGVTNYDGDGVTGVEAKYNSVLKGVDGRKVTAKDAKGNAVSTGYETVVDAKEGSGVVLTIDSNIQHYLENAITQALGNTGARGTYGIVMDVNTGAVLAMSNKPDFDLNDAYTIVDKSAVDSILKQAKEKGQEMTKGEANTQALYNQWNSFCITSTYEPGSTFKIFTASAALEEGVANLNTTYTCNGGYKIPNGPTIHCAKLEGHGTQTFTQGLMNSCNPFFISLGQKLGSEAYYKYFEAFGFTEKTGIDLPGEANSVYHSKQALKVTELASTSFGQSFRISPIQLITAACSVANGGKLIKPYVVDRIVDTEGNTVSKTEPTVRRQVISEQTAKTVRNMMEAVVEGGTGKNAYIPGYRVAGKTATSEKLDNGNSDKMKYVASFLCFAPANDPKVAILVGVDEPAGNYRGGGVIAAPIAKEVMESTLKYLNVQPQYTEQELKTVSKITPDLTTLSVSRARVVAAENSLTVKVLGNGDNVISQMPSAGQSIPNSGMIVVYTEENPSVSTAVVPSFKGMTAGQANAAAHDAGINIVLSGPFGESGAVCYNQSVEKGQEVKYGSEVTVYFHTTTQEAD